MQSHVSVYMLHYLLDLFVLMAFIVALDCVVSELVNIYGNTNRRAVILAMHKAIGTHKNILIYTTVGSQSDYMKKSNPYAAAIPTVINNWLKDPIIPDIFKGEIDVRYTGIIEEEIPQKTPNINLVAYSVHKSSE